ncbi:MAG: hypothetical protein QOJ94_3288 [Sphingomonadales bacterium]|jgi:sugar phosphate isomerase/epimerase|nr:hypothetical protein [Sphingomonadales bacterium]
MNLDNKGPSHDNGPLDPAIAAELAAGYDAWEANPGGTIPLEDAARRLREESERREAE